jgi:hypothetical protein
METIRHNGEEFAVQELSRPAGWLCRHLISVDGTGQFLEYVVSVGPLKVDVCCIYKLSSSQIQSHGSGALQLGELARQLAEEDERTGKHERA